MSRILFPNPSPSLTKSIQLRKVESLDWKRIASLDIEKIIEETDEETLREILPQIVFCQPDVEFDHNRTDPGFRKVFRLGQLIIEHLILSQEMSLGKVNDLDSKYTQVLHRSRAQEEEIRRLKNRLVEAKKELKRRKDLIQSSQFENYGGSREEVDQCPYCDKKFINTVYLYSHLQRRHQGLPAIRLPTQRQSGNANQADQAGSDQDPAQKNVAVASASTQTDDAEVSPQIGKSTATLIDRQIVNDLVEEYLKERVSSSSGGIRHSSETVGTKSEGQWPSTEVTSQGTIEDMKEALEGQWRSLIEKMHKTELEELKTTLLEEMHKMQEIITKSATAVSEIKPAKVSSPVVAAATLTSPSVALVGRVEERIQKQEDEFEHLKLNLQTKIRADIGLIESRMESQERFWRAKLRTVENEYQEHIIRLRQEFQASLHQQNVDQHQVTGQVKSSPQPKVKVNWPSDESILVKVKPPTPITSATTVTTVDSDNLSVEEAESFRPIPKPRPRSLQIQTLPRPAETKPKTPEESRRTESPKLVTGLPPKVPDQYRLQPRAKSMTLPVVSRGFEVPSRPEPDPELENVSNDSGSGDDTSSIGSYAPVENIVQGQPRSPLRSKPKVNDPFLVTSTDAHTETDDIEIRPTPAKPDAQAQGLEVLSRQLEQLGIRPDTTQVPRNVLKKSITAMKKRRESLNEEVEGFAAERELKKNETNVAVNAAVLESRLNEMQHSRRLSSKPLQAPGASPLSKMLRAVKSGGSTLKRKMSLMGSTASRKPKVKVQSPRIRPKFNAGAGSTPSVGTGSTPRVGAGSTPPFAKPKPPSRKSGPPPPIPPAKSQISTNKASKKKKPAIQTFFRRSILRKKSENPESDSDDELEESGGAQKGLKRTRPINFNNNTPTPTHKSSPGKPISAKRLSIDKGQPKVKVMTPDESHVEVRMTEIQRKAAKEIEKGKHSVLSRSKESPLPGPSTRTQAQKKRNELSDSDENFEPFQNKVYSSTPKDEDQNLNFEQSLSSLHDDESSNGSFDDISDIESEPPRPKPKVPEADKDWNKENLAASPKRTPTKPNTVRAVIYHDPMAGLNEFGLRVKSGQPVKRTESQSSSGTSVSGGTKKLKRLQREDSKFSAPDFKQRRSPLTEKQKSKLVSPKKHGDALNKSSDWETSAHDEVTSNKSEVNKFENNKSGVNKSGKSFAKLSESKTDLAVSKSKSPAKKPWIISSPKSKHNDYAWDSP